MSDVRLGERCNGMERRDAIHVPVLCVRAGERLDAGQFVSVRREPGQGVPVAVAAKGGWDATGIVDPWLAGRVIDAGDCFWMLLKPGSITTLRHEWSHAVLEGPVADDRTTIEEAVERLRGFAARAGLSYEAVIDGAKQFLASGERYCQYGEDLAQTAFWECDPKQFWDDIETITQVSPENRSGDNPFTCSC